MTGMRHAIDVIGTIYRLWSDGILSTELQVGRIGGVGGQEWTFRPSPHCPSLDAAEEAEIDRVVADWKAEQRKIHRAPAIGALRGDSLVDVPLWTGHGPSDHTD